MKVTLQQHYGLGRIKYLRYRYSASRDMEFDFNCQGLRTSSL